MSNDPDHPDDELRRLLRNGDSASRGTKPSRATCPAKAGEPDDLRALLKQGSPAVPSPTRRAVFSTEGTSGPSLQELLRASTKKSDPGPTSRRTSAPVKPKTAVELEQVLREFHGGPIATEALPGTEPTFRHEATADLEQTLRIKHPAPEPVQSKSPAPGLTNSPWLSRPAWVMAILLLASSSIYLWSERQLDGPPGTLQSLAKAVEAYRRTNGILPEQLARLEVFPKDAIEWPAKYWNARDAAGRTEIIWIPQGGRHYQIVLRQGIEVWIYQDRDGKYRLAVKGKP